MPKPGTTANWEPAHAAGITTSDGKRKQGSI